MINDNNDKYEAINDMKTNLDISENLSVLKSIYTTLEDMTILTVLLAVPTIVVFATIIISICIVSDDERQYMLYPLIIGVIVIIILVLLKTLFKFLVINQRYRLRKNIMLMISKKTESKEYRDELMKYKSFFLCMSNKDKKNNKYSELVLYKDLFAEEDKWKGDWYRND